MDQHSSPPRGLNLTGQIRLIKNTELVQLQYTTIGHGAFTDVYKGQWKNDQSTNPVLVAVKTWRFTAESEKQSRKDFDRRLVRESGLWSKLKHDNILPYHGYCSEIGLLVALISPLCEHGTIMPYLQRTVGVDRLKLVMDVLAGLEYLHASKPEGIIVHGDLSSRNVLIDDQRNARLCDFGRAKIVGAEEYSTKLVVGSFPYMAPELLPEQDEDDSGVELEIENLFTTHSDMYAFGMLCFQILANRLPFPQGARGNVSYFLFAHGKKELRRPLDDEGRITDARWCAIQECLLKEPTERPPANTLPKRINT